MPEYEWINTKIDEAFEEYLKKIDYHYTNNTSMLRHKEIFAAAFEAGSDYGYDEGYAQAEEDNSQAIKEYNNG